MKVVLSDLARRRLHEIQGYIAFDDAVVGGTARRLSVAVGAVPPHRPPGSVVP